MLRNLVQYREFIFSSVKREFLMKYTGSVLGIAWSVFQPLAMIFVYTVIFSNVMKNRLAGMETTPYAYSVYLCAGSLPWGLFAELLTANTNVFLANANLIKKVSFPRIALPVIATSSAVVNFSIAFSLFLLFLIVMGMFPWSIFPIFFLVLAVEVALGTAMGIGLGVMNVFFRDVGQMLNVVLQFWFWFTPIVYPARIIPETLRPLLALNPMYHISKSYQDIFLYGKAPEFLPIAVVFLFALLIGAVSLRLYRRHVGEMVDEL